MSIEYIIAGLLAAINLFSFGVMMYDKRLSRRGAVVSRVPEGVMFLCAAAFGSAGIYAGMFILRHKTRKWYFLVGVPLLTVQNAATVYFVLELFV